MLTPMYTIVYIVVFFKNIIMEEIVLKYLNDNYEITLKTYVNFKLYDKIINKSAFIQDIFKEVCLIFNLEDDEFDEFWNAWLGGEIIKFENKVTDIQYLVYEKTGLELDLQNPKWSELIDEDAEKYINSLLNKKQL